jgi:TRAP transporter TAXI family solute receptor
MLKNFLILISIIILHNNVIAQDQVPLPPIPQTIENNQSKQSSKANQTSIKKIPIKIGLSKTEDHIYLSLASTICIFVNEQEGLSCSIKQSNNPIEAVNMMLDGDVDIVMTNSLLGKYAVDGSGTFEKNLQFKKIKFLISLIDEKLTIFANRDVNVKVLDDLKNISINIGQNFTKQSLFFNELLRVKQWNISDFKRTAQLSNGEQIKAICDKTINGLIILGSDAKQDIQDITRFCEVGIIPLSIDELNLFNNDPRFIPAKLKGGIYIGIPRDTDTVAIKNILLTTSDVSSAQIANLLQIIQTNLKKIQLLHPSLKSLTLESMLSEGKIAPLHDGVKQFMQKNNLKEEN